MLIGKFNANRDYGQGSGGGDTIRAAGAVAFAGSAFARCDDGLLHWHSPQGSLMLEAGQGISATATDTANNTSAFAACATVTTPGGAPASGARLERRAAAGASSSVDSNGIRPAERNALLPEAVDLWFSQPKRRSKLQMESFLAE
jgi:hypothetical protein